MDYMFMGAKSFDQNLCGSAWVDSKASQALMFAGSSGSMSPTVCASAPTPATTQVTPRYVSRLPLSERELIVRKPIFTPAFTSAIVSTITCPKCGLFGKSGRASCCAPGGAWFKNCGGVGNNNVDYKWSEGLGACTRKFKANGTRLHD